MTAALNLIVAHRIDGCRLFLRAWEAVDARGSATGTTAIHGWWVERQWFRPLAQHALRVLGDEPAGHPTYTFTPGYDDADRRVPGSDPVPGRRRRLVHLTRGTAEEILASVGAPDFVGRHPLPEGSRRGWGEVWEYDSHVEGRWVTTRLTWEERDGRGRLVAASEGPATWPADDYRLVEWLGGL